MGLYVARRLLWLFVVIFFVSLITFAIAHAVPGGPFSHEKKLPAAVLKQLDQKYNLDDPLWAQYANYMGGIFIPRIITSDVPLVALILAVSALYSSSNLG